MGAGIQLGVKMRWSFLGFLFAVVLTSISSMMGCSSDTRSFEESDGAPGTAVEGALLGDLEVRRQLAASVEGLLHDGDIYLHRNFQGSFTVATKNFGLIRGRRQFSPYGAIGESSGSVDSYGFTGQQRDDSTGLVSFKWRHLDTASGKWLSIDPVFVKSTADNVSRLGESSTGYAYVSGRVINAYDQGGLTKMLRISSKSRHRGSAGSGKAIVSNRQRKAKAAKAKIAKGGNYARVGKAHLDKIRAQSRAERRGGLDSAMKKHAQSSANSDFISFAGAEFDGTPNKNFESLQPWITKNLKSNATDIELIGTDSTLVKGVENRHASGGENEWLAKASVKESVVTFRAEGVGPDKMRITKHNDPALVGGTFSAAKTMQIFYESQR